MKHVKDIQVVQACATVRDGPDDPNLPCHSAIDELVDMTGQPYQVCERCFERADRRGYIESGISLRYAWPTEKGTKLALHIETED